LIGSKNNSFGGLFSVIQCKFHNYYIVQLGRFSRFFSLFTFHLQAFFLKETAFSVIGSKQQTSPRKLNRNRLGT